MPDSLTDLIETLDDLVVDLNSDWILHKDLFQVPDNYVLFFESGPIVWHMLRDTLLDSVFLSIARLLDPPKTGSKENLSLARVVSEIPEEEARGVIQRDYDELVPLYKSALQHWRNCRLSHNDLLTATGTSVLPDISFDEVSNLIERINKIAQRVGHVVQETHKTFVPVTSNQDWVWQLTDMLKEGIAAKKAKLALRKEQLDADRNS